MFVMRPMKHSLSLESHELLSSGMDSISSVHVLSSYYPPHTVAFFILFTNSALTVLD